LYATEVEKRLNAMLHAVKNERGNMMSCDAEHSKLGERGKGDEGGKKRET
jgi:hypothetical protein